LGQIPLVQSICEGGDNGWPVTMDEANPAGQAFISLARETVKAVDYRNTSKAPTKIVEIKKH